MENLKDYKCPVCGFRMEWDLTEATSANEICPSCGIQFGYTDAAGGDETKRIEIYKKWRADWIASGMVWDKGRSKSPENWNPEEQLKNIPEEFK